MTMPESSNLTVLAVHRYFWPDTPPYASMLRSITRQWVEDGHEVDVLSSQPGYNRKSNDKKFPKYSTLDGVKVKRLSLPYERKRPVVRLLNVLRFILAILWQGIVVKRYDVIMVSTAPPVVCGWAGSVVARLTGASLIYHCMDVHPEIGRLSGEFRRPWLFNLLRKIDINTCRVAQRVVVLSEDMSNALNRDAPPLDNIDVINNFNLPVFSSDEQSAPNQTETDDNTFRLLFAGNLGRFQGLETAIEGMHLLQSLPTERGVQFWLMGSGVAESELKRLAGPLLGHQIRFIEQGTVSEARARMRECDAGLVSLAPDIYRYAYPSKTMTYLSEGCPLVVAVEPESELSQFVVKNDIGVGVSSGNAADFASKIQQLANSPERSVEMRTNALTVAEQFFSLEAAQKNWSRLLTDIQTERNSSHV